MKKLIFASTFILFSAVNGQVVETKMAGNQYYSTANFYNKAGQYYSYDNPNINLSNYNNLAEKAEMADKLGRHNKEYCDKLINFINEFLPNVVDKDLKKELNDIKIKIENFPNERLYSSLSEDLMKISNRVNNIVNTNNYMTFLNSINSDIQERKYSNAIEKLTKISVPDDLKNWKNYNLAISYLGNLDYENAMKYANNMDNSLSTKMLKGSIKFEMGDFYGADEIYENVLNDNIFDEYYTKDYVLNDRAYALMKLKKYNEALSNIDKAIEINSFESNYYDTKGEILYLFGKISESIMYTNKSIELNPNKNSYYIRGLSQIKQNKIENGCRDLSKAFELGEQKAINVIKTKCK